jgi:hypothetical protein
MNKIKAATAAAAAEVKLEPTTPRSAAAADRGARGGGQRVAARAVPEQTCVRSAKRRAVGAGVCAAAPALEGSAAPALPYARPDSDSDSDEPAKPVKKAKLTVETVSGWLCCLHIIITAAPALMFFKISSLYRRCLPQKHRQAADRYYVKARILESAMLLLCC